MKRLWLVLPIAVVAVLFGFLAVGLHRNPRLVPSPMIDKPAPTFTLPELFTPAQSFSSGRLQGRVWLLNVWASWCEACRAEHPLLLELHARSKVPVIGLDYKDKPVDGRRMLLQLGNPYADAVSDIDGTVAINYGVYGVPETFVVGRDGRIAYKQIGPITQHVLDHTLLPLIDRLSR